MKNFVLEFTNSEWSLYQYDEDLNNLPDIKGSEINKYFNLPDLAYWECEKLSIVANWDNIEEVGERLIEKIYKYINNQKKENRKMIKEANEQGLKSFTIQGHNLACTQILKRVVEEIRELEGE